MTDRAVQFEKLKIHRVERRVGRGEGFELADLSPSVALIHGPNGSGKSTTALVIQELLWPGRTAALTNQYLSHFRGCG
jgi:pantothenate kinase-related protein Tda10